MKKKIIVIIILLVVVLIVKYNYIEKFIESTNDLIIYDECPDYIAHKKLSDGSEKYLMFFKNKHFEKNVNPLVFNSRKEVMNKLSLLKCNNKNKKSLLGNENNKRNNYLNKILSNGKVNDLNIINFFDLSSDFKKIDDTELTINEQCHRQIAEPLNELNTLIYNISVYTDPMNSKDKIKFEPEYTKFSQIRYEPEGTRVEEIKVEMPELNELEFSNNKNGITESDFKLLYKFIQIYKKFNLLDNIDKIDNIENKELDFETNVNDIINKEDLDKIALINIYDSNNKILPNKYEEFKNNIVDFGKLKTLRFLNNFIDYLNNNKKKEYDLNTCLTDKSNNDLKKFDKQYN